MSKNGKQHILSYIVIIISFIYFVISGFINLKKISGLEKKGVISNAVVESYSLESNHYRYSTFYHVSINYYLKETKEKGICKFNFYPENKYEENMEFLIIRNSENDFELPLEEITAYKRSNVKSRFISAVVSVLIIIICDYVVEKVSISINKKRKKEKKAARKNPELKEKIKKRENRESIFIMILLSPFLLFLGIKAMIEKYFKGK